MSGSAKRWVIPALIAGATAARMLVRRLRAFNLNGRCVLITGGSRGLGLLLAHRFARLGARVVICARDAEELAEARAELESAGAEVLALQCDVTSAGDIRWVIDMAVHRFGAIDVLVNNAGIITVGPAENMTLQDYENSINTHFFGPLLLTQAVLPEMLRRGEGRIVNITSIGGKVSIPHLLPYCAGKFALVGFSEGLHAELAGSGVVVTTVCPGLMRTGSAVHARTRGNHRAEYAWFSAAVSSPLTAISAGRAARRIVDACRYGEAELVLSGKAKMLVRMQGMAPGITTALLGVADRLLPGPEEGMGPPPERPGRTPFKACTDSGPYNDIEKLKTGKLKEQKEHIQ